MLCLAENLRTDVKDLAALLTTNNCDIRQSVLYLQFWVKSGGGYLKDKHLALQGRLILIKKKLSYLKITD